jgi:hypothetical protein
VFRPGHRCMTFCGRAVICCNNFLALVALTAICRCYQGTVFAIQCELAVKSSQVNPRLRHQGSKPSHEIQWLEDDVGSASIPTDRGVSSRADGADSEKHRGPRWHSLP